MKDFFVNFSLKAIKSWLILVIAVFILGGFFSVSFPFSFFKESMTDGGLVKSYGLPMHFVQTVNKTNFHFLQGGWFLFLFDFVFWFVVVFLFFGFFQKVFLKKYVFASILAVLEFLIVFFFLFS